MTTSSTGTEPPNAGQASRSALLWVIGGLGVAGLFLWCLLVIPGSREAFPTGDAAVIELYTLQASRGWWEYGPYSRWGWHHPGPLMFYALAPFYTAAHAQSLAISAGSVAINLIAVTVVLWALARHASVALTAAVTLSLAVYLWRLPPLLVSGWNPHLVLLPFAALIVAASIAAAGRLSLLPVTIAMTSFVSQTHIGVLPCAAVVTACALVAGTITWKTGRSRWFWLGVSALTGFILWLPPIIEQVTHGAEGNLAKIVRFFLTPDPADPSAPFAQALRVWAAALVAPLGPAMQFPVGGAPASEASTPIVALALSMVALVIAAGWRARGAAVDAWFCRLCALASIVAIVAMTGVRQGFGDYMVAWISLLGVMNTAALAAAAFMLIARRSSARTNASTSPGSAANVRHRWIVPVMTSLCLIAVIAHGALALERLRAERAARDPELRERGDSVYIALRGFLAKARVQRPLIRVVGTWDNTAAIVLQMQKRDQPVAVSDDAIWLMGPRFLRDGTEDADMALADISLRGVMRARDGDCMLIERHGLSLHVLLPSLRSPPNSLTCQ